MGTYSISIPDWHPTPLNLLLGHWAKAYAFKKLDRAIIWAYSGKVPKAACKRSLHVVIRLGKGERAADPDAYWKSLNDALVHACLLVDDNRQGVELLPIEFERGKKETIITLTDI